MYFGAQKTTPVWTGVQILPLEGQRFKSGGGIGLSARVYMVQVALLSFDGAYNTRRCMSKKLRSTDSPFFQNANSLSIVANTSMKLFNARCSRSLKLLKF